MSTEPLATWPELVRSLDSSNGVVRVAMESLRLLEGAQRLSRDNVKTIKERLRTLGVGHLPTELPMRGDRAVVLYRQGTMAAEVIRAIQEGLSGSALETAVGALQRLNSLPGEEEVVPVADLDEVTRKAIDAVNQLRALTEGKPHGRRK